MVLEQIGDDGVVDLLVGVELDLGGPVLEVELHHRVEQVVQLAALAAGADGYLLKESTLAELLDAISSRDGHSGPTQPAGEAPSIEITEPAAERIRQLLGKEGKLGSHALRMKVVGGGCSGLRYELAFDDRLAAFLVTIIEAVARPPAGQVAGPINLVEQRFEHRAREFGELIEK